ncbi:MAG: hypothetical protein KGP28_03960 [Bdellovibrionales bacterium]|nr:hypothetical protein [Bdellovibrionales bacterium]
MNRKLIFQYALRSLIPAWRFFDEVETHLVLEIKPKCAPDSEWRRLDPSSRVGLAQLFFNPSGLLVHGFQNFLLLVQRDSNDPRIQSVFRSFCERQGKMLFPESKEFEFRILGESK